MRSSAEETLPLEVVLGDSIDPLHEGRDMKKLRLSVFCFSLVGVASQTDAAIQSVQYDFKNFANPPAMGTASVSWSGSFPGQGEV